MKDTIIKLFNLEPSELKDIEIVSTEYSVHAIITLNVKRQNCPACGCSTKRIHDYQKQTLTHAVIHDVYTSIIFNQRRYKVHTMRQVFPGNESFCISQQTCLILCYPARDEDAS